MNCSSCSSNNRGYLKFASLSLGCKLIINSIDVLWLKGRYKTVNSIYGRTILLVKLRLQLDTFLNYESSTLYNSFIIGSFQEHNNPSRIIDSYFNYSFDYQGASLRTFNTWEYFFSLLSTYAFFWTTNFKSVCNWLSSLEEGCVSWTLVSESKTPIYKNKGKLPILIQSDFTALCV
jgi:hypothetical protein